MTIEQRSAKSWRVKQMIGGTWYRVSVDHKPSKKEALELIAEAIRTGQQAEKGSFKEACEKYISIKTNVLSPRTVREYSFQIERLPEWLLRSSVQAITAADVQKAINELAVDHSAKTVRNLHAFISSVLKIARPGLVLRTTLPQLQKVKPHIPDKGDLVRILKEAEGGPFSIPIKLACYGLRRGEICALELSDLDNDNVIHITKDLVYDSAGEWVKKPPKTPSSVRIVPIDKELADEIRSQGYIYKGFPGQITKFLARTQKRLGMEPFSLHKLRHLFASTLLDQGENMKTIQELGGWAGPQTVINVYLQSLALKDQKTQKKITKVISGIYKP